MADIQQSSSKQASGQAWEALGKLKQQVAIGLLILAALLALIPVFMGLKYRMEYLPVCLWGGALALVVMLAGLWRLLTEPRRLTAADATRLLFLTVGGLGGL